MTKHKHKWQLVIHMDTCHSYQSTFSCKCGDTVSTYDERDPVADPYSNVWMEINEDKPCARCKEIQDGAKLVSRTCLARADGTTKETETEYEQGTEPSAAT